MKHPHQFLVFSLIVVLSACSGSGSNSNPTDTGTGTDAGTDAGTDGGTETTANYRITFNGNWSAGTHPVQYPASAHFSGLIGAVHNDQVIFWEPGQIATAGIELMAETGGKGDLLDEVNSAIGSGYALAAIDGAGLNNTTGSVSVDISVSVDYPLITMTTMLAPSPDWFAGFHNIRLYENGAFIETLTIDGVVYDSGTDSGLSFTSDNIDTQPKEIIARTNSEPTDSSFVDGLPSVGQFVIERL